MAQGLEEWISSRHVFKRQETTSSKTIIILNALVNIVWEGPYDPFDNQHKNLHFHNEKDIHMSSKIYEESVCGLVLDLLTILSELRVSYSSGSGLVGKSNRLRPIYLIRYACDVIGKQTMTNSTDSKVPRVTKPFTKLH